MARKSAHIVEAVELTEEGVKLSKVESTQKKEYHRIPPLYLDKEKDKQTIEELEAMVEQSPFKSESEFVRQMLRVMLPVLKDHPMFSTKAAIAFMLNESHQQQLVVQSSPSHDIPDTMGDNSIPWVNTDDHKHPGEWEY
jgi:tRNA G26 N,N-dimethylase Trm1